MRRPRPTHTLERIEPRTLFSGSLPDLSIASASIPSPDLWPGAGLYVTRTIANAGPYTSGFNVRYSLSTDDIPGNAEDIPVAFSTLYNQVDAHSTSTATDVVQIPTTTPAGTYRLVCLVDAASYVAESDESNNLFLGPTISLATSGPQLPDLYLEFAGVAGQRELGSSAHVNYRASNLGGVAAPQFVVALFLSTDDALSTDDIRIDANALPWYSSIDGSFANFPLPASTLEGTYHAFLVFDPDNLVPELDETNNSSPAGLLTLYAPTAPLPPGYVPTFQSLDTSTGPFAAGQEIAMWTFLRNFDRSYNFPVRFYLSADPTAGNADDVLVATATTSRFAGYSPGDSTGTASAYDVPIPSDLAPGTYYIYVTADNAAAPMFAYRPITVFTPPTQPDLAFHSPNAFGWPKHLPGDRWNLFGSPVANLGKQAAGKFSVALYLSTDPTLDPADLLVGSTADTLGPTSVLEYLPGGFTLPNLPGTYYPILVLDPDNLIAEADESNNTLVAGVFTILNPQDAGSVTSLVTTSDPVAPGDGLTILTTMAVNPRGLPSVDLAYVLSVDSIFGNDDDIPLGVMTASSPRALGVPPVRFTVPASTPVGAYHLLARASYQILDTTYSNDFSAGPIVHVADPASPSTPPSPTTSPDPSANPSANPAAETKPSTLQIRYYLSDDRTLSADDTLFSKTRISANSVKAVMQAAAVALRSAQSKRAAGGRFLIAAADTDADPATPPAVLSVSRTRLTSDQPHLSAAVLSVKPGPNGRSTATLRVTNPGPTTIRRPLSLTLFDPATAQARTFHRTVSLSGGQSMTLRLTLPWAPSGPRSLVPLIT